MTDEDLDIVGAMDKFGGSFVKALAKLCYYADPTNLSKIKETWWKYWLEYAKIAQMDKERQLKIDKEFDNA